MALHFSSVALESGLSCCYFVSAHPYYGQHVEYVVDDGSAYGSLPPISTLLTDGKQSVLYGCHSYRQKNGKRRLFQSENVKFVPCHEVKRPINPLNTFRMVEAILHDSYSFNEHSTFPIVIQESRNSLVSPC